jgi:hypothetical protein
MVLILVRVQDPDDHDSGHMRDFGRMPNSDQKT